MHIIKYPMSQGELPQLEPIVEYHLISPRGTLAATFEERDLAFKRWNEGPKDFKLVEVTRRFREITPGQRLELVA